MLLSFFCEYFGFDWGVDFLFVVCVGDVGGVDVIVIGFFGLWGCLKIVNVIKWFFLVFVGYLMFFLRGIFEEFSGFLYMGKFLNCIICIPGYMELVLFVF